MVFSRNQEIKPCTVCDAEANIFQYEFGVGTVVDCARCGSYKIASREVADDANLPLKKSDLIAVASYLIRQLNGVLIPVERGFIERPVLTHDFFTTLKNQHLPTPNEASNNLLLYLAKQCGSRPGKEITVSFDDLALPPTIGVVTTYEDVDWVVENLKTRALLKVESTADFAICTLTWRGWERVEELQRMATESQYAFFARKFDNTDLDKVYADCLVPAVRATGFDLRTVTQKAGLVDAVIEDEIRRCAFLLADLSDDNAGAYWEAGFAEGLGKAVIYICKERDAAGPKKTHFDANHRHTVRWDLATLDKTAVQLKAVIRNTLLGRARQSDA